MSTMSTMCTMHKLVSKRRAIAISVRKTARCRDGATRVVQIGRVRGSSVWEGEGEGGFPPPPSANGTARGIKWSRIPSAVTLSWKHRRDTIKREKNKKRERERETFTHECYSSWTRTRNNVVRTKCDYSDVNVLRLDEIFGGDAGDDRQRQREIFQQCKFGERRQQHRDRPDKLPVHQADREAPSQSAGHRRFTAQTEFLETMCHERGGLLR